ncbi:Fc.00g002950.m01.CDS01 [Cosmosporella sp. VM-42]
MKLYPSISQDLGDWAERQPVFFTGSAPTHGSHINVSPKGLDSHFAVLGPNQCAYIDRTGSGCETIAHSYDNGRLCLMFMSFGPSPRILRFFCRSKVIEWDEPAFPELVRRIAKGKRSAFDGARAVIVCDVFEVQTSCGFGVPRVKKGIYAPDENDKKPVEELLKDGVDGVINELSVFEERPTLDGYWKKRADNNTAHEYQNGNNLTSIDGLPGLKGARRAAGETIWLTDLKAKATGISSQYEAMAVGFGLAVLLYAILAAGLLLI